MYTIRKVNTPHQYTGNDIPTGFDTDEFVTFGEDTVHYYVDAESELDGTENIVQFNYIYYYLLSQAGGEQNLAVSITSSFLNESIYGLAANYVSLGAAPDLPTGLGIAKAQWGNLTYVPLIPASGAPEYYEAADYVNQTLGYMLNLTVSQVDRILYGLGGYSLTNSTGLGTWLTLVGTMDFATLASIYGSDLTLAQVSGISAFISYHMTYTARSIIYNQYRAGFVAKRTVHEWLYEFIDPLATKALGVPYNTGLQSNNTIYTSEKIIMKTGTDVIENIWQEVAHWDEDIAAFTSDGGQTLSTSLWKTVETIGGTDATHFAPDIDTDDPPVLTIFSTDTWRKLNLTFVEKVELKGIDMLRYHLEPKHFLPDPNYYQLVPAYANMSQAKLGLPIFLSLPHVHNNSLSNPDYDENLDVIIEVEPITGVVMNAHKRLQMNLGIETSMLLPDWLGKMNTTGKTLLGQYTGYKVNYIDDTTGYVPFAPIFWADEYGTLSDSDADDFKSKIYDTQELGETLGLAGLISGPIVIVVGVIVLIIGYKKNP